MAATRENGELLLAAARKYVPALADFKLGEVTLGNRVLPADSFPIVGHLPGNANAYVAAMHSGMTMAPLIGELVATGIGTRLSEVDELIDVRSVDVVLGEPLLDRAMLVGGLLVVGRRPNVGGVAGHSETSC